MQYHVTSKKRTTVIFTMGGLGIVRPDILPPAVVTTMEKIMKKKVLKCLQERKVVGIGLLIPATIPQVITELMKVMAIGIKIPATITQAIEEVVGVCQFFPATIPLVIAEDMLIEVDIGHKRPSTLPLEIGKQELMLNGGVDIGLRKSTITPITKVNV